MFLRYGCATVRYGRDRLDSITCYAKLTRQLANAILENGSAADGLRPAEGIDEVLLDGNGRGNLCLESCIPVTV